MNFNPLRYTALLFVFLLISGYAYGQVEKYDDVEQIWESRLVNHTTGSMPEKGQTSVYVVHYFSPVTPNGFSDMFGIYGSANIQMGAEYGIGRQSSAYFLTEKLGKAQELGVRHRLVQQSLSNGSPISISAAFSWGVDARDEKYFGDHYYFVDRFFYTTQFTCSRQSLYRFDVMANITIAHFNIVPEECFSTFLSFNPAVAYKLNRSKSVFAAIDLPVGIASAAEESPQSADPILTLGLILQTPTHNFQLFVSNGQYINPAREYLYNHSGLSLDAFRLGFNIHVKLGKDKVSHQNK